MSARAQTIWEECVRGGGRNDGGWCPRLCTRAHPGLDCNPSEVCLDFEAVGSVSDLGFFIGCYSRCENGGCPAGGECRTVRASLVDSTLSEHELCVPVDAMYQQ
jgi:hypothetical protein